MASKEMRYFAQSLAYTQPTKIRHFFWSLFCVFKLNDGGTSAIVSLLQNLFVTMTPSYDSLLR